MPPKRQKRGTAKRPCPSSSSPDTSEPHPKFRASRASLPNIPKGEDGLEIDPQLACFTDANDDNAGAAAGHIALGFKLASIFEKNQGAVGQFINLLEKSENTASEMPQHPPPVMPQPPSSSADISDRPDINLREAANTVLGDIHGDASKSINPISCHSFKEGIGPYVSDKIKEQIWANQYFDLATLLPPPQTSKPQNQESKANNTPFIHTPDQWTTAFIVFVAIYSEKFPNQTPGLMKHMEIVRDLGSRGGNAWKTYDENFRQYRHKHAATLSWGDFLSETWSRSFQTEKTRAHFTTSPNVKRGIGTTFRALSDGTPIQKGFCIAFAKGNCSFENCRYWHKCAFCNRAHPTQFCRLKKQSSNTWQSQQSWQPQQPWQPQQSSKSYTFGRSNSKKFDNYNGPANSRDRR